ncbi:MAG: deoxyribonuclease V [Phycisphaerae bacterium]|nr:deoxyribonuclease V [Phycisphaerae bacterium]
MIKHSWNISPTRAIAIQQSLSGQVSSKPLAGAVNTVAGTDCAFRDGGRKIAAVAVLCDAKSMEVLESASVIRPCEFPYIPGLLSFREAPAVIAAVKKLSRGPDLLMCDGQGLAHPRGLGLASHVGLWLDVPAIGVAKSRLCGTHRTPGANRRCRTQLVYDHRVVGAVVRTRTGVKPLYISVGHRVTLADAIAWTLRCGRGVRLPEPTRRAHQLVSRITSKG